MNRRSFLKLILAAPVALAIPKVIVDVLPGPSKAAVPTAPVVAPLRFERFVSPIIRSAYPNLVATELISVQPLAGPTSLIFFVDSRYGRVGDKRILIPDRVN